MDGNRDASLKKTTQPVMDSQSDDQIIGIHKVEEEEQLKVFGEFMDIMQDYESEIEQQEIPAVLYQLPEKNLQFIQRKEQLGVLNDYFNDRQSAPFCITGQQGIGQTELAQEFAMQRNEQLTYSQIIWFNSEYSTIAYQMKGFLENVLKQHTSLNQNTVDKFYNNLDKVKRVLIIFDNVVSQENLIHYLPRIYPMNWHILITSCDPNWSFQSLVLNSFNNSHLSAFLKVKFPKYNHTSQDLEMFQQITEGFPLGINLACHMMEQRQIFIPDYSQLFEFEMNNLPLSLQSTQNISTIFLTSYNDLKKKNQILESVVYLCSYQVPHSIDQLLIEGMLQQKLDQPFEILIRYGIIVQIGDQYKIHRLIQSVIRLMLEYIDQDQKWYTSLYNWLNPLLVFDSKQPESIQKVSILIPHAILLAISHKIQNDCSKQVELFQTVGQHQLIANSDQNTGEMFIEQAILESAQFGADLSIQGQDVKEKKLKNLSRAESLLENYFPPNHKFTNKAKYQIAMGYIGATNFKKSESLLISLLQNSKGNKFNDLGQLFQNLGFVYDQMGDRKRALENYLKAFDIIEKELGLANIEAGYTAQAIGIIYGCQQNFVEKQSWLEKARKIFESSLGFESAETARCIILLGRAFGELGLDQKKRSHLKTGVEILEKQLGNDNIEVGRVYNQLAQLYGDIGKNKNKSLYLFQALDNFQQCLGKDHQLTGSILCSLGDSLIAIQQFDQAKECLDRALEIAEISYGIGHLNTAFELMNLGQVHLQLQDLDKAEKFQKQAYTIFAQNNGENHPNTKYCKSQLNKIQKLKRPGK